MTKNGWIFVGRLFYFQLLSDRVRDNLLSVILQEDTEASQGMQIIRVVQVTHFIETFPFTNTFCYFVWSQEDESSDSDHIKSSNHSGKNEEAEACSRQGYENLLRDLLTCLAKKYRIEEPCGSSQVNYSSGDVFHNFFGFSSKSAFLTLRRWNMRFGDNSPPNICTSLVALLTYLKKK